jgi:hypothetical protein
MIMLFKLFLTQTLMYFNVAHDGAPSHFLLHYFLAVGLVVAEIFPSLHALLTLRPCISSCRGTGRNVFREDLWMTLQPFV